MAITVSEAYFNSSTGKNKIHTLIWKDEEVQPVGVLQIAHGVCEHIERYDDFARFLVGCGFVVVGNDHLGHGKSVNAMEELGCFADENGDVRMIDDMHILYRIMKKRYPELPYFLFGHSMGSLLARQYCAVFGYELSGAIFCGTGNIIGAAVLAKAPLDKLVEKLGADSDKVDLFALNNKMYNQAFRDENDEYAWLSRNVENRENYRADPYCGFPLKVGGFRDLATIMLKVSHPDWAFKVPVDFPILLISGAKDPVGSNGKGVLKTVDALEKAGNEPTVILYPGDRHEILNEDDKDIVYSDIKKWLCEQLAEQ